MERVTLYRRTVVTGTSRWVLSVTFDLDTLNFEYLSVLVGPRGRTLPGGAFVMSVSEMDIIQEQSRQALFRKHKGKLELFTPIEVTREA